MTDTTERWLPVPGYEGFYEVSSLGQVRSLDRIIMNHGRWGLTERHLAGKILAQRTDNYGYKTVRLFKNGYCRQYRVHRLVGEVFLGRLEPGMETRHGPHGKQFNGVSDICYGTRIENMRDKIRDGTNRRGSAVKPVRPGSSRNGNARLTYEVAEAIRRKYKAGARQVTLATEYGVTQACISQIVLRKTWADQAASPS